MVEKSITCAQLSELESAGTDGYHRLLEDYTGIKAAQKICVIWGVKRCGLLMLIQPIFG